jgi:hypothetical protein
MEKQIDNFWLFFVLFASGLEREEQVLIQLFVH